MSEPVVSSASHLEKLSKQSKGGAAGALETQTSADAAGSGTIKENAVRRETPTSVSSNSHTQIDGEHSGSGSEAAGSAAFAANMSAANPADAKDPLLADDSRSTETTISATAVAAASADATRAAAGEKHDARGAASAQSGADSVQRFPAAAPAPLPAPSSAPILVAPMPQAPVTATTVEPQFFTLMVRVTSAPPVLCAVRTLELM